MNKFNFLKRTAFGLALATGCFFTVSAFANETVPVSNCRYTGIETDRCFASGGGVSYEISSCCYNTVSSSCGITPVEPAATLAP